MHNLTYTCPTRDVVISQSPSLIIHFVAAVKQNCIGVHQEARMHFRLHQARGLLLIP